MKSKEIKTSIPVAVLDGVKAKYGADAAANYRRAAEQKQLGSSISVASKDLGKQQVEVGDRQGNKILSYVTEHLVV